MTFQLSDPTLVDKLLAQQQKFNTLQQSALGSLAPQPQQQLNMNADDFNTLLTRMTPLIKPAKAPSSGTGIKVPLTPDQAIANAIQQNTDSASRISAAGQTPDTNTTEKPRGILGNRFVHLLQEGIARPMDIVSRPGYAIMSGLKEIIHQEAQDLPRPEHITDVFKEVPVGLKHILTGIGSGSWAGLSGQQKTGFGDVINETKKLYHASQLMESNPGLSQKDAVAQAEATPEPNRDILERVTEALGGFAGDVALNPSSWFSGGTTALGTDAAKQAILSTIKSKGLTYAANQGLRQAAQKTLTSSKTGKIIAGALDDLRVQRLGGNLRRVAPFATGDIDVAANAGANEVKKMAQKEIARQSVPFSKVLDTNQIIDVAKLPPSTSPHLLEGLAVRNKFMDTFPKSGPMRAMSSADIDQAKKIFDSTVRQAVDKEGTDSFAVARQLIKDSRVSNKRFQLRVGFLGRGANLGEKYDKLGNILERAYRPLGAVGEAIHGNKTYSKLMTNAFDYGSHFPGLSSFIRQRALAGGIQGMEDATHNLRQAIKGTSTADREVITKAIQDGTYNQLGKNAKGVDLAAVAKFIKTRQEEMWSVEGAMGKARRGVNDYADNYMYGHFHSRDKDAVQKWTEGMRKEINATGHLSKYTLENAKAAGLKPEMDAARSLLAREGKFNRDLARQDFYHQMLDKYGVRMDNAADLAKYNMKKVDQKYVTTNMAKQLGKKEQWAIPSQYHDVLKKYNELMRINSPTDASPFIRIVDQLNRYFKTYNTVLMPSFHARNAIGDSFMSWLDGTGPRHYARALRARATDGTMNLAGKDYNWRDLWERFKKHEGASTFYNTELPNVKSLGGVMSGLRNASQLRENTGRYVHFTAAFEDELKKAAKAYESRTGQTVSRAGPVWKKLEDQAELAAQNRMNKFNFDYSAVTPFEQKFMRRAVPFYTFARKSIPLMFENLYTSPGRLLAFNKAQEAISNAAGVDPHDPANYFRIPQWIRDIGYTRLNNETQPTLWSWGAIPFSNVGQMFGGATTGDVLKQGLSQTSPLIRMPIEIATGKSLFSGSPVNPESGKLFGQKLPDYAKYVAEQLAPTRAGEQIAGGMDWPTLARLMGIDIRKVTTNQQLAEIKRQGDPLQVQISKLNQALASNNLTLSTSNTKNGKRVTIKDPTTGAKYGTYTNVADAQKAASELMKSGK